MIGPWGPLGRGVEFLHEVNGEILRNLYLGNAWGDRHQIRRVYIHPVLPEVFSAFGVARSRGGVPAVAGVEHFLGRGYSLS